MSISLRSLRYLVALDEHRHFGRAAEALGITQPALTRSLQGLEEELGVRLMERHQRGGVEPTAFGQLLLERGQKLLLDSDELVREVALLRGLELGELTVSAGLYPAELSVAPAVGKLIQQHPKLRCHLKIEGWRQATDDVLNRRSDFAVAESSVADPHSELSATLIGEHAMVFFCRTRHPLLKRTTIHIEDVVEYPWVATRGPKRMVQFLPKDLKRSGHLDAEQGDFLPAVVVDDLSSTRRVVAASDGIGAAPLALIQEDVRRNKFAIVPCHPKWLRLHYGVIALKHRMLSPAAKALIDIIVQIEKQLTTTAKSP
ncbi:MAG: LysR family transcriptional regulator [Pirellula sp.]|jgi:DNA-binding transcriptional LysR family regulator